MPTFAQVLQTLMQDSPPAPRPCAPFEEALRSFEDDVARARLTDKTVATGTTGCAWAQALGVQLPCTVADIKRAYRRLALRTHPDCQGGSHAAFLAVQALVQEALAALEQGSVTTQPQPPRPNPYSTQPRFERHVAPGRAVLAYA